MFDIGFWELVVVAVIGLLVLGPERLPIAIRTIAQWLHTVQRMAHNVKSELSEELKLHELQQGLRPFDPPPAEPSDTPSEVSSAQKPAELKSQGGDDAAK